MRNNDKSLDRNKSEILHYFLVLIIENKVKRDSCLMRQNRTLTNLNSVSRVCGIEWKCVQVNFSSFT